MKFLLDVNESGAVAHWLLSQGHDLVEVGQKDPKMPDKEILDWAVQEQRIIITSRNFRLWHRWVKGLIRSGIKCRLALAIIYF